MALTNNLNPSRENRSSNLIQLEFQNNSFKIFFQPDGIFFYVLTGYSPNPEIVIT
jgi:hypothetical protein